MTETRATKVLFLAPDPSDAARLRLGREFRNIQARLEQTPYRLESRLAVRPEDVLSAVLDIQPQIVHFCGHGLETGEICLEDNQGHVKPVHPEALASLFKLASEYVRCVVINTCYAEEQVRAIAEHIPFVIGMKHAVVDDAAITFATGFYTALRADASIEPQSIDKAYEAGCVAVRLAGIPEKHLSPVLFGDLRSRLRLEIESVRPLLQTKNATLDGIYRLAWREKGKKLGLLPDEVEAIIQEALKPLQDVEQKFQKYEQAFKEAIRQEYPLSQESRKALQFLRNTLGLTQEEAERVEHPIIADPALSDPKACLERGFVQYQRQDYHKAIASYERAIELKPTYSHAFLERGFCHYHLGDKQAAITDYTQAIEVDGDWGIFHPAYAYIERGLAYEFLKDMDAAIADYTRAIELKSNYSRAYLERGYAHYQQGDRRTAIQDYTKAIDMNSNWDGRSRARAYLNRGLAYYYSDDKTSAVTDWTETIRLKPNYSLAYYNRALAYADLGDKQAALQDYTKAIEVNGDWGTIRPDSAYLRRGLLYYERGNIEGALKDFQKADPSLFSNSVLNSLGPDLLSLLNDYDLGSLNRLRGEEMDDESENL